MSELAVDDFIWRALAGGVLVALMTAPLGCFVVWQRMAYFGDALSHSALLGVALGLLAGVSLNWSLTAFCMVVALVLVAMQRHPLLAVALSQDTRLGLVAHGGLAAGLVLLAFIDNARFDLHAYLFGDVLTVSAADLGRMAGVLALVAVSITLLWKRLLLITVSEDIARVEGLPVLRLKLVFTLLLALVVASAIQIVGVLLTASLLIVPAAAARTVSDTPEKMAVLAVLAGLFSVAAGIGASLAWDLPAGPAIVLAALAVFIVLQALRRRG